MPETDRETSLNPAKASMSDDAHCNADSSCCDQDHFGSEEHGHSVELNAPVEPCPPPLMWQEVRESFLRDSELWEIVRGPHRLVGRTFGTGAPLYFLNNFAGTAELFALVVWLLHDDFRCVVFDAVTDDSRSARRSKPTMAEFANDLIVVADHHGDRRIAAYGAGFGAAVLLQAAVDYPNRLERIFLQHGFVNRRLSFFERLLASVCLRSGQVLDRLPQRRRFQAVNHKPWFPPFDQTRFDFLIQSTGTLPLRDLARRAIAVSTFDVSSRVGEIKTPVTIVRTEGEGKLAAESQSVLETRLNSPRVEWLHSAGQHPYLTHPHRIAKIIR